MAHQVIQVPHFHVSVNYIHHLGVHIVSMVSKYNLVWNKLWDLDSLLATVSLVTFQVLRSENIEYVVAPYEADAQLAYLCGLEAEKGGIAAVITEDSDLIAYGCQAVRTPTKLWYDADGGLLLSWWPHFHFLSLEVLVLFWFLYWLRTDYL